MLTATPAKLRNGTWGARVKSAAVSKGDTVTITTRAGKSWTATVTRVLWTGDGVSLCAVSSGSTHSRPRRSPNGECQCGACDDLLSIGYRPGQRVRCTECGGWAEAC